MGGGPYSWGGGPAKNVDLLIQCLMDNLSYRYYHNYLSEVEARNFVSAIAVSKEALAEFEVFLEGAQVAQLQQPTQLIKSGKVSN